MRAATLNELIGRPWRANAKGPEAFDCWHLCVRVERELFGRSLPVVDVPQDPSWNWMLGAFEHHPERRNWTQVAPGPMGLVSAGDGALVLMARRDRPAHIGVWLEPERRVLHADAGMGVVMESLSVLRMGGWHKLRFYEPNLQ